MIRTCAECGKPFEAKKRTKYCSAECREKTEKRRAAERRATEHEVTCPTCGKHFHTVGQRVFCSRRCKDRWYSGFVGQQDMRIAELEAQRQKEKEIRERIEAKRKTKGVQRTETGAIWYPVSGAEMQRMAREQHRTYGEIAAEFLSKQVRCVK